MLPPDLATARLDLVQPPMTWLVAQAAALAGGRLIGSDLLGSPLPDDAAVVGLWWD